MPSAPQAGGVVAAEPPTMAGMPSAPARLMRCLGEVVVKTRSGDRLKLFFDGAPETLVVTAERLVRGGSAFRSIRPEPARRPGVYRLALGAGGRHRITAFLDDAAFPGWKGGLRLVRKRAGGEKSYGPEMFATSAACQSPALAFEAGNGIGRLAVTSRLPTAAAFILRVHALDDGPPAPSAGSACQASCTCLVGPGRTEVADPLAGSGPRIAMLTPARMGGATGIVGIEALPEPAARSAGAAPEGTPEAPAVADAGTRRRRIHVVGISPRTGTTLMAEAISACFHVDQHSKHEDSVFTELPGDGAITLTKNPGDIQLVRALLPLDPDLYVICMLRDPRDVIVSVHGARPGKFYTGLKYWKAWLPHWRRLRDHPRFVTVRYEELVRDPDRVQADIHRCLPFLTRLAPFSRFHEVAKPSQKSLNALNGLRAVAPSSIGVYRFHLGRVRSQIEKHGSISAELIETGYESDSRWEVMLHGVESDPSESELAEFHSLEVRRSYWRRCRARMRDYRRRHLQGHRAEGDPVS